MQFSGIDANMLGNAACTIIPSVASQIGILFKRSKLVPKEGLVEVTPADHEYWDVFDKLRAPTHCGWGQMDDAWISSLHRVQNKDLLE